ncbi:MAG: EamA family transporter [Candidatus Omnitrophica bacterium]|nr:EamA family transporter [Candidatus Omnitrophota bacterium]
MKKSPLTFKVFLLIIANDVCDAIVQALWKKGTLDAGISDVSFRNVAEFISLNASSVYIWLGIVIYVLNFFIWVLILSRVELSVAMPAGSTTYIMIPLIAIFFFKEQVSLLRWIGIAFIILGIFVVSRSRPHHDPGPAAREPGGGAG